MKFREMSLPRCIFITLAILFIFIQAYRVPVNVIGPGLDQSFPHILNLFSFTSIRFGSDIVYTYGPLGFLLVIENVGNNLTIGFAFWTALYLIFSIAMGYFVFSLASSWRLITSTILAVLVAGFIDADRLIPCLVMLLLLIAYEEPEQREKIFAFCGGLVSIGLLIKFPIGIACAAMSIGSAFMPMKLHLILRNLLVVGLSITLTFCSLWFFLYGSLEGMANYFLTSFELTRGYTAVMSSARLNEEASLISFIVALGLLFIMMIFLPTKRRFHTLLVMPFPLFIGWKHGVVRFDAHIIGLVSIAMFSAFLLIVLHLHAVDPQNSKSINRNNLFRLSFFNRQIAAIGMFLLVCISLNQGLLFSGMGSASYPLFSSSFMATLGGIIPIKNALRLGEYKKNLGVLADRNLVGHTLDTSILELLGKKSVDIYSYELGFVAANPELNFHPKPIFQHFNAFTDKLDKLNADFFASSNRPEFLITHHPSNGPMVGVDGRHPLYDDPIAILQIMGLYKPVFVERNPLKPQVALLESIPRNKSRFGSPVTFKSEAAGWNETIILPADTDSSILRVKIDLKKSIFSSLKEAAFRLSPIHLVSILSDGTEQKYRLVPTHLASGVWISPLFVDYWNFYDFLGGAAWMGPKVVAIRFEADNPQDYPDSFMLAWERIACKTGYCFPEESRVFSSAGDHLTRSPIPLTSSVFASFISPADSIASVDVFLSTYAKTNQGTLTLEIVDKQGAVLRKSTVDAAMINDNAYKLFAFDPIFHIKGQKVWLRLGYRSKGDGMIAAWKTEVNESNFDYFRVYGH